METIQNPVILNSTPANLGDYTVVIMDNNGCTETSTLTISAANCACSISAAMLSSISCNDGGTSSDDTDDIITFTLDPQVMNGGTTYSLSSATGAITPPTGNYGLLTTFQLPTGSAGGGNVIVTIVDANNPACTVDVPITDPGTCSGSCNITAPVLSLIHI